MMEKIKILFVDHELVCGGAEQALFDLVNLLDKDKFEVTGFAQHDNGEWIYKFWDAGINVVFDFSCRKATWNPLVKVGNIVKKLKIRQAYKNNGKGLLETCFPKADIVVSYAMWENEELVFLDGAKTVKYIHGDCGTNHVYRDTALSPMHILERFDRIVCVSHASCESLKEWTGLRENVSMHFNPINSDNVRKLAEEPVRISEDVPVICAVGRLSEEKGFERLIVIHKKLLDQGINHKLLIVGDGRHREFVERTIRATETQDSVILTGYQQNPYPYMKNSRFMVCPSYTEGLPVISMEALCLGIPIVSAVPSIGEIFGDEVCGLITENDNNSLEAGIRRMLTDDAFYQMAKAGAKNRSAFFDGKRMVKEVEELFLDLMKEQ